MTSFNTYAGLIISDNPAIVDLVIKYASSTLPTAASNIKRPGLVKNEMFERALQDPHAKYNISNVIATLPRIIVVQKEFEDLVDKVSLERTLLEKASLDLDEKIKYFPDVDEANRFLSIFRRVNDEYRKLLDIHIAILETKAKVSELSQKGSALLNANETEWVNFRANILQQLVDELNNNQFPLVDIEKAAVLRQENWAELMDDIEDLNLELPKRIDVTKPSFETYYAIKDIIAKSASLGRRMLPNSFKDIDKISTPKKFLKGVNKSAEKLVKEQDQKAKALTKEVDAYEKQGTTIKKQLENQDEINRKLLSQAYKPPELQALNELAEHSWSDWRAFTTSKAAAAA